jgi:hypothetical protein
VLDLETLVGAMQLRAGDVARGAERGLEQRAAAVRQVGVLEKLAGLRQAVGLSGRDMAMPAAAPELGRCAPPPPVEGYTVLAADGSQIAPDYHHVAPWYVVNAGCAVFRYEPPRGRERCRLAGRPRLLPEPVESVQEDQEADADARATALSYPSSLEAERLIAELEVALELIHDEADPGRTVLLLDGPLVQWRMLTALRGEERARAQDAFRAVVAGAREREVPLAGYISRSRAVEWVTLLRFSLCPEIAARGALCAECRDTLFGSYGVPPPDAHHAPLAGLRDGAVAQALLAQQVSGGRPVGWRTPLLELRSTSWNTLTGDPGAVGFFYIETGSEIARVELPHWVWENPTSLALLHGVLADQCEVGNGYPLALAEAHEAAVVRGPERTSFYALVERVLADQGVDRAAVSAKAASKSRPMA